MGHEEAYRMNNKFPGPVVQLAYRVDDLEAAALRWVELGAGPFFVVSPENVVGQLGSLMIELKPLHAYDCEDPPGLHHVASFVDDFDAARAAFEKRGVQLARLGETNDGMQFACYDTSEELGHQWEIYPPHPSEVSVYEMVAAAAKDWDGVTDPIRHVKVYSSRTQ
jgi:hypothetical protein